MVSVFTIAAAVGCCRENMPLYSIFASIEKKNKIRDILFENYEFHEIDLGPSAMIQYFLYKWSVSEFPVLAIRLLC